LSYLRDICIEVYGEAAWRLAQASNREGEAQEMFTEILRGEASHVEAAIIPVIQAARISARDLADRTNAILELSRRQRWSLLEGVRRGTAPEEWITFYRQVAQAASSL
jgi:hypothetical protein